MRRGITLLGVVMLMTACAGFLPTPEAAGLIVDLDREPRATQVPLPRGGVVAAMEVVRGTVDGDSFRVTVHADGAGACLYLSRGSGGGGACGAMPDHGRGEADRFGIVGTGAGDGTTIEVFGLVSRDVPAVAIETQHGRIDAVLVSLDVAALDASLFVTFLPAGLEPRAVVAIRDGNVLERFDLGFFPGMGDDVPTPAAPDSSAP